MVMSREKSVLVSMTGAAVFGKPTSKWGIAVNTLYTIFTAHHFMEVVSVSATAALTKVKEICIYLIWPVVHISTKRSLNRSMGLFSGHYRFFHYKVTQKTGVQSKLVPPKISKCNSRQYRPSLSRAWNYFLICFTNTDNVTEQKLS